MQRRNGKKTNLVKFVEELQRWSDLGLWLPRPVFHHWDGIKYLDFEIGAAIPDYNVTVTVEMKSENGDP